MPGDWTLTLKNLFLPIFCRLCGMRLLTEENGFFCPTCWEASPRVERPFCLVCGRPQVTAVGIRDGRNYPCGPCSVSKEERPYGRIFGAATYEGAVEEAIKLFKFQGKRKLAEPLAAVMVEFAEQELDVAAYNYVVPVPLYRVRARHRGFNQSELLARSLMGCFSNAELDEPLVRIRPTKIQSRLTQPAERLANVRGAFAVKAGAPLLEANVLLIDDVVTTGGTAAECARVLRTAGAARVDVFAAALAVAPSTKGE